MRRLLKKPIEETMVITAEIVKPQENPQSPNASKASDDNRDKASNSKPKSQNIVIDGIEFVDLGLSVRWANMNIGASGKNIIGNSIDKTNPDNYKLIESFKNKGALIPNSRQWNELITKCEWTPCQRNDNEGYLIKGQNGNSIFLPYTEDSKSWFETFERYHTTDSFYRRSYDIFNIIYLYIRECNKSELVKESNVYCCPVTLVFQP